MCVQFGPLQLDFEEAWQLLQLAAAKADMPAAWWLGSVTPVYVLWWQPSQVVGTLE